MALTATVRRVEDVAIVDLNGRITLGENTRYLREEVRYLLSQRTKNIVLRTSSSIWRTWVTWTAPVLAS
jgi:hypothetical protein